MTSCGIFHIFLFELAVKNMNKKVSINLRKIQEKHSEELIIWY
jgi:hypothetical protein